MEEIAMDCEVKVSPGRDGRMRLEIEMSEASVLALAALLLTALAQE